MHRIITIQSSNDNRRQMHVPSAFINSEFILLPNRETITTESGKTWRGLVVVCKRLWNFRITVISIPVELNPSRQGVGWYEQPIQIQNAGRLYRSIRVSWLSTNIKLRHSDNNGDLWLLEPWREQSKIDACPVASRFAVTIRFVGYVLTVLCYRCIKWL